MRRGLYRLASISRHLQRPIRQLKRMSTAAYADEDPPVASLEAGAAWKDLSQQERRYAYWLTKASWAGGDIIRESWTPYAIKLNQLLLLVFSAAKGKVGDFEQLKSKSGVSDSEWKNLLDYVVQVLANLQNYRTFGNTKFIPRIDRTAFEKVVKAGPQAQEAQTLWSELADQIYSPEPSHVGKPNQKHLSNYYPDSPDISDEDVAQVLALTAANDVSSLNTRLRKNGPGDFTLLIASSHTQSPKQTKTVLTSESPKLTVRLQYGDFSKELSNVIVALKEAQKHAANQNQVKMLEKYVESFETGDIAAHEDGSRAWVKDQGPIVESYIGFIETYVDPYMARAEWEGFVSVVNKSLAARFTAMVDAAPQVIKTLPWGPAFENDVFIKPDYSGLTILSFATGGIPAGINIPNFDNVRADTGYKNVALLNVMNSKASNEKIKFCLPDDAELLEKWRGPTFEVQVANHEVLGHGSGKILREDADGKLNFDKSIVNPLTGEPVSQWYKPGETPNGKIGAVYAAFEEMRAEAVGMFLCLDDTILDIFGYTSKEDRELVPYTNYLLMAYAGIRALEYYSPETGKHGQAHMEARIGILRWLIKDGVAAVHIEHAAGGKKVEKAYITVDRKRVFDGTAKASMGRLLVELQVRRSIGDGPGATKFINELTAPPQEWRGALRDFVIANRIARKCFIQPNMRLKGDDVELIDYPTTAEGLIQSCIERDEGH